MTEPDECRKDIVSSGDMNLLDLLIIVFKYKIMIVLIVGISLISGLFYLYVSAKPGTIKQLNDANMLFYSECLIEPSPGIETQINLLLLRRNFVLNMLKENKLLEPVQKAISQKKGGAAQENQRPEEVYGWFRDNLFVTPINGIITIGFTAPDEELPIKIINGILNTLGNYFREQGLKLVNDKKDIFHKQLDITNDPILKLKISERLALLMEDEVKLKQEFGSSFRLLDSASFAEKIMIRQDHTIEHITKWTKEPSQKISNQKISNVRNGMIMFLLFLSSLMIAIFIAFFREYLASMASEKPEKIAALKKFMKISLR